MGNIQFRKSLKNDPAKNKQVVEDTKPTDFAALLRETIKKAKKMKQNDQNKLKA